MKKRLIITEEEKKQILSLHGKLLKEDGIFKTFAEKLIGKNANDIAQIFKTESKLAIKIELDNIIKNSIKKGKMDEVTELTAKLMQYYNPTGKKMGVNAAKKEVKNMLDGYAKSHGYNSFGEIQDEIVAGVTKNPQFKSLARRAVDPIIQSIQKHANDIKRTFNNATKPLTAPDKKSWVQWGLMKFDKERGKYTISGKKIAAIIGVLGVTYAVFSNWLKQSDIVIDEGGGF